MRRFKIAHTWNGTRLPVEEIVEFYVSVKGNSLILTVTAPFYNDPPPPMHPVGPYARLDNYEVVRFFLLNRDNIYLEVQLGP